MDIKELPSQPELDWTSPEEPSNRHLSDDIMSYAEFCNMRKRIGGRNALVPKTNFSLDDLEVLKKEPVLDAIKDDYIISSTTMEPDAILFLKSAIEMFRPQLVVELGAGLSTIVLAAAHHKFMSNGKKAMKYVSIEQSQEHLDKTLEFAEKAGVRSYIEPLRLDLCRYKVGDEDALDEMAMICYDFDEAALHKACGGVRPDMVIVDGPMDEKTVSNASMGKTLIWPILSLYAAPGAVVFLNNAYADPEIFAMEQWQASGAAHILGIKAVGTGIMVGIKPG